MIVSPRVCLIRTMQILTVIKMSWIYSLLFLLFLARTSIQTTTEADGLGNQTAEVTSATVITEESQTTQSSTISTKKPTTTASGIQIKPITKPPTTAPPKTYLVSRCESFQVACDNNLTVYIDKMWNGRKANKSCTSTEAACCEWVDDPSTECLMTNVNLIAIQRQACLQKPGESCVIFEHSSHNIPCHDQLLFSHFTLVEFRCIDVAISTTAHPLSATQTVPTSATRSTSNGFTTVSPQQGTTPKPLPIPIIAGAAGGGVGLILIIVLIVCCVRRSHQRKMKQDMTKPELGVNPVSEIGVNYVDEGKDSIDPDIIKTAPRTAYENDYTNLPLQQIH